jgi:hypothetical protein
MPGEQNILPVLCNLVVTGRAIGPEAITGAITVAITEHRMCTLSYKEKLARTNFIEITACQN